MADDDRSKSASLLMNKIASELYEPESILARLSAESPAAPAGIAGDPGAGIPPRTQVEKHLFEIWVDLLGFDDFGVEQDFFELGGHSLLAMQIISRAQETFGVDIPMNLLWMSENFSVETMASAVEQALIDRAPQEQLATAMRELGGLSNA
jgi:acyl carrier protein